MGLTGQLTTKLKRLKELRYLNVITEKFISYLKLKIGEIKMKSKFLLLFFLLFCLLLTNNYSHDLRTPRGTPVEHLHFSDTGWYGWQWGVYGYYTQEQWSTWSDQYYKYDQVRIDRANQAYNCHAYAWAGAFQSDPNTYCWLNTPNDDTYWNDGSYNEVSSTVATHVNYTVEDHSLQLTGGSFNGGQEVISKWGRLPLYRHRLLYDCYGESAQNVKYF
jgi:hypothetical protein